MSPIDFGLHTDDYAEHRPGFPPSFYERLERIRPLAGVECVDLATGPGTIAFEVAARGGRVTGIDISASQIASANRLARERSVDARFLVAGAESTGLAPDSCDLITAGQCWHWFDGPAALAEARRLLRPGGHLVIAHYCYLAEHSAVARETEELILQLNPGWTMGGWTGIFPEFIDDVIRGGLELVEQFCYDHLQPFTHAGWRGRMRTCNGVGSGGMQPEDVARFDAALADVLARKYPDPVDVEHRVWCVIGREPA